MSGELSWPKRAVVSLCELVRPRRSLWDPNHEDYPKRKVRHKMYEEVTQELKELYPAMTFLNGGNAILTVLMPLACLH